MESDYRYFLVSMIKGIKFECNSKKKLGEKVENLEQLVVLNYLVASRSSKEYVCVRILKFWIRLTIT